jgi:hypothetical protein
LAEAEGLSGWLEWLRLAEAMEASWWRLGRTVPPASPLSSEDKGALERKRVLRSRNRRTLEVRSDRARYLAIYAPSLPGKIAA